MPQTSQNTLNELPNPQQIMDLLGNQSYDINTECYLTTTLKNMDLFLSIDLPKVEHIEHVPPQFPECDNWAAPHRTNRNQHVYYSSLGFGRNNHGPMTELNSNTSEYLAEAIHITVCNQYKNKYVKLLECIETIK